MQTQIEINKHPVEEKERGLASPSSSSNLLAAHMMGTSSRCVSRPQFMHLTRLPRSSSILVWQSGHTALYSRTSA
jgi:hypothetical protein